MGATLTILVFLAMGVYAMLTYNVKTILAERKKRLMESHKRVSARIRKRYKSIQMACAAGILKEDSIGEWFVQSDNPVDIEVSDLPKIRTLWGEISVAGKDVIDGTNSHIYVKVSAKRLPCLNFQYKTELSPDAKCKIVESVSTYRSLACDIS
jgi:hypothetical protein